MLNLINHFRRSNIDLIALRLSVILIFFIFANTKWFEFEVEILKPMISKTWLNFLYDLLGYHATSYFLGVVESIGYISLIIGFWKAKFGILGDLIIMGTALITLSILPQLGFNGFIFKDVLLIGAGLVLLKSDLNRLLKWCNGQNSC